MITETINETHEYGGMVGRIQLLHWQGPTLDNWRPVVYPPVDGACILPTRALATQDEAMTWARDAFVGWVRRTQGVSV